MDSISSSLEFDFGSDSVIQSYANISVTVPLGSNSYTSAFSFPDEILVKEIRASLDLDTLGGAVVRSEFDFYGSVSVTSLAGVFDLKDRIRFNKQFLEAKKLFKGAGFEKSDISETTSVITDTILSDTTKVDSVSSDTTDTTSPPDSLTITQPSDTLNTSLPDTTDIDTTSPPDSLTITQPSDTLNTSLPDTTDIDTTSPPDSLTITQPSDTLNISLPDTTVNDTSNVVHSDSAAVNKEEEPHTGEETNTEEESPSEQTDNTL
jgi:hypothetical protein